MIPTPGSTLADRFARILGGLRRAVAACGADKRVVSSGLGSEPLLVLLWTRLGRVAARFAAMAAGLGADALDAPRPARQRAAPRSVARPSPCLPRGFGWLLRMTPEAACYASQLQHLLAEPEFSALVSAKPALGRVLRPLCRMLGIEPPLCMTPPSRLGATAAGAAQATASRAGPPPASAIEAADAPYLPSGLRPIFHA